MALVEVVRNRVQKDKKAKNRPAFAEYSKMLVRDQNVPEGIPWAARRNELEEQGAHTPTRARRIRGKLNVPRECFWTTDDDKYRVAAPLWEHE